MKIPLGEQKRGADQTDQDWDEFITRSIDDTIWLEDPENAETVVLTKPENYIASQGNESVVNHLWSR